ncbi:MAG: PKD domain-containing protein [Saprospiraceae bacterium]
MLNFCTKTDHIWLFGATVGDNYIPEIVLQDSTWRATNIDFNFDPPKIYYDSTRVWDFGGTNASICDDQGQLICYTNGQAIYSGSHTVIEDTINYNAQWDNWSVIQEGVLINTGLPTIQGALILPWPEHDGMFYVFYSQYDLDIFATNKLLYGVIKKDETKYEIIEKDIAVLNTILSNGSLTAVKHANGRDWWILGVGGYHNTFYLYLFDTEGIHFFSETLLGSEFDYGLSQMYFSSDGNKIGFGIFSHFLINGGKIGILNFNRSTGILSNIQEDIVAGTSFSQGVSFSPNSRFLYGTDSDHIFQYDLEADNVIASRLTVATYDGFEYSNCENCDFRPTRFGWMGLGPDGKIYITSTTGNSRVMHVINNPNQLGVACDVKQHGIFLPTVDSRSMPNFPNFRLGPLDGSSCDTLGIDNHPIAKYRYVQDSLEDLKIHFFDLSYYDPRDYDWDFGDSYTSDMLEPTHVYESTGVYEVCLTVSNDYDTHTTCKTIMLGTTSTEEEEYNANITLFPNPVSDYLTVSFHDYLGLDMVLKLYDVRGNLVNDYPLEGAYTILDLRDLTSGVYVYRIFDGRVELENGKVIFGGD